MICLTPKPFGSFEWRLLIIELPVVQTTCLLPRAFWWLKFRHKAEVTRSVTLIWAPGLTETCMPGEALQV